MALGSSLCEFNTKDQVSIAVYKARSVSLKGDFCLPKFEMSDTYSHQSSHKPLLHRSALGS